MGVDGHRLAGAFRTAADNPAPSTQPPLWTEGFCDGLRFAAALLDLAADDRLTPENLGDAIALINAGRS